MKSLTACIIGQPNAGKSTLLNQLIGEKISIVTPKIQTTRSIITGILTINDTQLILFDTPGIFTTKKSFERSMVRCAWSSLANADLIILLIDNSQKFNQQLKQIITRLQEQAKPIVFLLNKMDIKSNYSVENIIYLEKNAEKAKLFRISALNGKNIEYFITYLSEKARETHWLYDKEDITTLPSKFLASEITREQLFLKLHEELPYNLTVENEAWQEQKNGSVKIYQVILVGRETYKNIIIGKKGAMIKEISYQARINIEKLLQRKVHLFLFVKLKKDWQERALPTA